MGRNNRPTRPTTKPGGKRKRRGLPPQPVDWERVSAQNSVNEGFEPSHWRPSARPSTSHVNNGFVRRLTGFSDRALTMMLAHDFKDVDEEGVKVAFTGVSQAPRKEIPYAKPGLTKTRGGVLVVSGMVDPSSVAEIGNNGSRIEQVDAPDLEGYDAPRRLNVGLGREPVVNFDQKEFAALVAGSQLIVSRVVEINGRSVDPYVTNFQGFWKRPPQDSPSMTGFGLRRLADPYGY